MKAATGRRRATAAAAIASAVGPYEYHREVDAAFQSIAAEEPERVQLVDASGSPDAVTDRLIAALSDILP